MMRSFDVAQDDKQVVDPLTLLRMTCARDYIKERELKKIALVVISVIVILLCVACSPQTLSTPKELVVEYNVLSWDKVENADSYVVWVNGEVFTSSANFIELSLQNNVDYEIKVKAVSNGKYGHVLRNLS